MVIRFGEKGLVRFWMGVGYGIIGMAFGMLNWR